MTLRLCSSRSRRAPAATSSSGRRSASCWPRFATSLPAAPMSGVIARKVVQYFGQHGPAPEVQTLTPREHQVLVALSQGEQYKEIAARLDISINTVRRHIMAIYDKLHVNTRLDAVGKLGRV